MTRDDLFNVRSHLLLSSHLPKRNASKCYENAYLFSHRYDRPTLPSSEISPSLPPRSAPRPLSELSPTRSTPPSPSAPRPSSNRVSTTPSGSHNVPRTRRYVLTTVRHDRLFGVTTLDVVRSSAFLSTMAGTQPAETNVPVVGGHSGVTIVPLLSQTVEGKKVVEKGGEVYAALVKRIQFGGDEVVKAKDGAGSATLSMAYGSSSFPFIFAVRSTDGMMTRQPEPSSLTPSSRPCEVTRTLSSAPTSTRPFTPTRESPSSLPTSLSA